jgi:hypothetical protein
MDLFGFTTLTLLLLVIISQMSQARFQVISKAYDILWGKASSSGEPIEAIRKVDLIGSQWSATSSPLVLISATQLVMSDGKRGCYTIGPGKCLFSLGLIHNVQLSFLPKLSLYLPPRLTRQ